MVIQDSGRLTARVIEVRRFEVIGIERPGLQRPFNTLPVSGRMQVIVLGDRTDEALATVLFFVESLRNGDMRLLRNVALGILDLHNSPPVFFYMRRLFLLLFRCHGLCGSAHAPRAWLCLAVRADGARPWIIDPQARHPSVRVCLRAGWPAAPTPRPAVHGGGSGNRTSGGRLLRASPARESVARSAPAPRTTRARPTRALGDPVPLRGAPGGPTGHRYQGRSGDSCPEHDCMVPDARAGFWERLAIF